ncbi:MAG: hypothetical protein HYT40_04135 [Candidatus Sungbacteria bacterium]|uniref:Uncharacterized protein n=1 Tax=Candidatus Sungiibacteriota bacterium TaxID=2750080 RepID=A0A931WPS9_9BACT|nr:hypothetical protein [Candidatus Sungbacteria bacterium]
MLPSTIFAVTIEKRGASPKEECAIRARTSQEFKEGIGLAGSLILHKSAKIVRDAHVCGEIFFAEDVIGS